MADTTDRNTPSAPLDPTIEYGALDTPLSDLGKSGLNDAAAEPTRPTAVAIDISQGPREPIASNGVGILSGNWSTGLFNCFDFMVPNCVMATFCPCVSVAQIATRIGFKYSTVLIAFGVAVGLEYLLYGLMNVGSRTTTIESSYSYDPVTGRVVYTYEAPSSGLRFCGYIAFLLNIAVFIAFWQLRTRVRQHFELPGSCVEDFFVSWCCSCCSIAQMATHVKSYKPHGCDFGPPDELPAYAMDK
jgi:Cys-rich protein (TIGR01571 family)